jgi:hypothetical protein
MIDFSDYTNANDLSKGSTYNFVTIVKYCDNSIQLTPG